VLETLDIRTLPCELTRTFKDDSTFDVEQFTATISKAIAALAEGGVIKQASFGFAFGVPMAVDEYDLSDHWDDPAKFVWCVGGWGAGSSKYVANAARKMRPMLRSYAESSLEMYHGFPEDFRDKVDSRQDDGSFAWGDFPWGGGVRVPMCGMIFTCAVSGFSQAEDHAVALLLAGLLGKYFVEGEGLLTES